MKQILFLSVLLLGTSWAVAQNSSSPSQSGYGATQTSQGQSGDTSGQGAAAATSVEGCLSGSDGQYTLTDTKGMTYQLSGDTSKLAEHVGHEIKVRGTESSGSATASGATSGAQRTLEVSSVKHISKTCKNNAATGGTMSH